MNGQTTSHRITAAAMVIPITRPHARVYRQASLREPSAHRPASGTMQSITAT